MGETHFHLWFSAEDIPALEQVSFYCHKNQEILKTIRGRTPGAHHGYMSFQWSSGVRAVAVMILRIAAWCIKHHQQSPTQELPVLRGEQGSLAASLDYAISKQTNWLLDMFGSLDNGDLIARELFLRTNPDRRRSGPVTISFNFRLLPCQAIKIFINQQQIIEPEELLKMANAIENNIPTKEVLTESLPVLSESTAILLPVENTIPDEEVFQHLKRPNRYFSTAEVNLQLEYLNCLKERNIARKFNFLGHEAAKAWLELCDTDFFSFRKESMALLRSSYADISKHLPKEFNCLIVRPGPGVKEAFLLRQFIKDDHRISAGLIDISPELNVVAESTIADIEIPKRNFVVDFMLSGAMKSVADDMRQRYYSANVIIVLGSTIGTYPQSEFLENIRKCMSGNDVLLLGAVLANGDNCESVLKQEQDALHYYGSEAGKRMVTACLLRAGIVPEDGEIEIDYSRDRFNPDIYILELYFHFKRNALARVLGQEVRFVKGERILLSQFYRYGFDPLVEMVKGNGFNMLSALHSPNSVCKLICNVC